MATIKSLEILQTFDSFDWRECGDFLKGRMRIDHDCIQLYDLLKKRKEKISQKSLDISKIREQYFDHITPKSFTNLLSKLVKFLEEYLVFHQIKEDETDFDFTLLKALNRRGLYNEFNKKAEVLENKFCSDSHIDVYEDLHLLRLNHLRYFSENPIKNKVGHELLNKAISYSESFNKKYSLFIDTVLIHLNEVSNTSHIKEHTYPENSVTFEWIQKLNDFKIENTDELYHDFKEQLTGVDLNLSTELQTILLEWLIYSGYKKIRQGQLGIIGSLLDLYEYGFRSGQLLSNNRITENTFINVVSLACAYGEHDRSMQFIEEFEALLPSDARREIIDLSKAHISFYKESYSETIDMIRDYKFSSRTQLNRRRWLLICSFYSLYKEDYDFMSGIIKNYESYFYNNQSKISTAGFKGSLNLAKVIKKHMNGESKRKISDFAGSVKHLMMRSWLKKEMGI